MRKGTERVFNAWRDGRPCRKQVSFWTDGRTILSYRTPILVKFDDGSLTLNVDKYSITTTIHQNGLRRLLDANGIDYTIGILPVNFLYP